VVLVADALLEEVRKRRFDCVVAPGGMPGATHLAQSKALSEMLVAQAQEPHGGVVAAICAAPAVVLEPLGLLRGHRATCHPAFGDKLISTAGGCSQERVVIANGGRLITSRGPGTAIEFALAIVGQLEGPAAERNVNAPMLTHL
jgi:4-methyl-5(b-hydroxyethyl)-thiazole monophosphate biosynthesis